MEVKIGVQHASRELVLDVDLTAEEVTTLIGEARAGGGLLELTDTKHRTVVVPTDRLAYVEMGPGVSGHVGFRH